MDKPYHQGIHKVYARRVREAAYADASTRCWRCGLTLAEKQRTKPDESWDAGHLVDGQSLSPLLPEHASCNRRAGGILGNKRKSLNPSRRWF